MILVIVGGMDTVIHRYNRVAYGKLKHNYKLGDTRSLTVTEINLQKNGPNLHSAQFNQSWRDPPTGNFSLRSSGHYHNPRPRAERHLNGNVRYALPCSYGPHNQDSLAPLNCPVKPQRLLY